MADPDVVALAIGLVVGLAWCAAEAVDDFKEWRRDRRRRMTRTDGGWW